MQNKHWIGYDFDGTLARQPTIFPKDGFVIGEPIWPMVAQLKEHLLIGHRVKIFTARAASFMPGEEEALQAWCLKYLGEVLEITATKDHNLILFFDDKARHVEFNTGRVIG